VYRCDAASSSPPLDGAAAAWPVAARVQQTKRVGVLMNGATSEPTGQSHLTTFVQGLRKLGWIDRQNLRIEVRWSAGDTNRMQAYATDLVGLLRPDVVLVASTPNLIAPQRSTRTIPIVFTQVTDPVAQGFVPNLTQPSGTGVAVVVGAVGALSMMTEVRFFFPGLGEDQATHLHDHPEERPHAQHGNLARRQSGPLKRSSQRGS